MEDVENNISSIVVTFAVGAVFLLIWLVCGVLRKPQAVDSKDESEHAGANKNGSHKSGNGGGSQKGKRSGGQQQRKTTAASRSGKVDKKHTFTHPWMCASLCNHSSAVLDMDFSPNGKYLASCAEDRTVSIFNVKDLSVKEHRAYRANVEYDHATQVKFSPDAKAFIISLSRENCVRVMKIGKKEDGSMGNFQTALDFPVAHKAEILNIGISSCGKYIMTSDPETCIKIWNLRGDVLATVNTNNLHTNYATISPCGRFVAACGFTPDVKVWQVNFTKAGEYKDVTRAFELKGHSAGVYCCSFSANSDRMASVSKDGTWRLWATNVEFHLNQDPYQLSEGTYPLPPDGYLAVIALSPDAHTVAVGSNADVMVYDAASATLKQTLQSVHAEPVTHLVFNESSSYLLSAGDRRIVVLHNVVGLQATIADLKAKKQKAVNAAMKERLEQQIQQAKKQLKLAGVEEE